MFTARAAIKEILSYENKNRAQLQLRFFKTGPGQYGEGDLFLGLSVPTYRQVSKKYFQLSLDQIKILLQNKYHDIRAIGLFILVQQYQKSKNNREKKRLAEFYFKNKSACNNWDLVDLSCYKIYGEYSRIFGAEKSLRRLAKSKHHWDRRIAIVSTFAYIRHRELDLTFELAEVLLNDREDLMHKATGWMLREAGKRDISRLKKFIDQFGSQMPRTMLRYAIEKFPETQRKKILLETKLSQS